MLDLPLAEVRDALVAAGITGPHQSHARDANVAKIHDLLAGNPEASFGLSGIDKYSPEDVLALMAELTGCSPDIEELGEQDMIDPDRTADAIVAAARRLSEAAERGAELLAATGHPTGLLEHHMRVTDAYVLAGGKVVRPREDEKLSIGKRRVRVRYVGGVACLTDGAALQHTHGAEAMEALLETEPWPDIVLGDHGFAGAAIERDIPTVAVMDINDHALALGWAEKADVVIIPMDDNRAPRLYEPSWRLFERVLLDGRA